MSNSAAPPKVQISFDAAAIRNLTLNSNLQSIDEALKEHVKEPEDQMAILMMAQVLCFARLRRKHNITGPRRKIILKKALEEFEAKVRRYGFDDAALKAVEVQGVDVQKDRVVVGETRMVSPGHGLRPGNEGLPGQYNEQVHGHEPKREN